jgi:quercetin dioxygenase-like cupin family protein
MQKVSFLNDLYFSDKPQITMMYESSVSKEIRICMAKGNIMKEHKAPGAISIMLLRGKLLLGSQGDETVMEEGEMVSFEPKVPHSLEAMDECVIRLTLSKEDKIQRIHGVINKV